VPSAFLSHQGIILPLKTRFPEKFDGTALVFGSMMVDFEYVILEIMKFLSVDAVIPLGHSFVGIFSWVLPISIFCSFLFSRWIGPAIASIVQKIENGHVILSYFGFDQLRLLKLKRFSFRWLWMSFYSALLGALSHLLLDLPSHEYIPWFHPFLLLETFDFMKIEIANYGTLTIGPISWKLNLTIYNLIWLLESIIFAIVCLYYLRKIKSEDLIKKWYGFEKK
jgi:hypothetical protein